LPRGKLGLLSAEGGSGKTHALLALGVSIVTGRAWLGYFHVPVSATTGRVLLALGEEDPEEVHRRVWRIAEGLKLDDAERQRVAERIIVLPLAGLRLPLVSEYGATEHLLAIRRRLDGDGDEWALVGLDPLSRFATGEIESSNAVATMAVQILESLSSSRGAPTVILACHSSKWARRSGTADVRGVTAVSDAARWCATLTQAAEGRLKLEVVKSNYTLRGDAVTLVWRDHALIATTDRGMSDDETRAIAALEKNIEKILTVLRREGPLGSADAIGKAIGLRAGDARAAVQLGVSRGLIVKSGTTRNSSLRLALGPIDARTEIAPLPSGEATKYARATSPYTPIPVRDGNSPGAGDGDMRPGRKWDGNGTEIPSFLKSEPDDAGWEVVG